MFEPTLSHSGLAEMVKDGAVPIMMRHLASMDLVRKSGLGFNGAASGAKGASGRPLDPNYAFIVKKWLRDFEGEQAAQAGWMPSRSAIGGISCATSTMPWPEFSIGITVTCVRQRRQRSQQARLRTCRHRHRRRPDRPSCPFPSRRTRIGMPSGELALTR